MYLISAFARIVFSRYFYGSGRIKNDTEPWQKRCLRVKTNTGNDTTKRENV